MMSWGLIITSLLAVGVVALPAPGSVEPNVIATVTRVASGGLDIEKCIRESKSHPRWEISNLDFTTINYNTGGRIGDITFNAYNPAVETMTSCRASNIDMSGASKLWHDCTVAGTGFQFALTDYGLKLKGTWNCGDTPLTTFTGEGTLSSGILHCEDYPHEARGWQTVCNMENGTIDIIVPKMKV